MRFRKNVLFALSNLISLVLISGSFYDSTITTSRKPLYRSSNKRTTDIIHTKLDVKFDWNKSQLIGEATILATAAVNFKL